MIGVLIIFILCLIAALVIMGSLLLFVIKRRNELMEERNHYKVSFDNATTEITRLSVQLLKVTRETVLRKHAPIILTVNAILDRVSTIGYEKLTKEEKDFLNNIV